MGRVAKPREPVFITLLPPLPKGRCVLCAALLEDAAFSFIALDDTTNYVRAWRDHYRSVLRAALEATGQKSSTTLVRGLKIGLRERRVQVCLCCEVPLHACPVVQAGGAVVAIWITDGETLYVDRAEDDEPLPTTAERLQRRALGEAILRQGA